MMYPMNLAVRLVEQVAEIKPVIYGEIKNRKGA